MRSEPWSIWNKKPWQNHQGFFGIVSIEFLYIF